MGARVSRFRVGARGGSVTLSKSNFLITLAPYFFPLYTILVVAAYGALSLFYDLKAYEPLWLGLVGLTWSFHLTFTISTLRQHQPDIRIHGRLFSYAFIYLFNLLGIALWLVAVTESTFADFSARLGGDLAGAGLRILEGARYLLGRSGSRFEVDPAGRGVYVLAFPR